MLRARSLLLAGAILGLKCKSGCSERASAWLRAVNTATLPLARGQAADVHVSLSFSDPILQVPVYVAE